MKKFWSEKSMTKINQDGSSERKNESAVGLYNQRVGHWSVNKDGEDMGGSMDGCGRVVKLTLIGINIATFIGGAISLGVGIWMYVSRSFPSTLMTNNMYIASLLVVLAMGAASMLLCVLGCCGAAREVKCMLLTYYTLGFLIFVVMLVGGILQFIFRWKVAVTLNREMHASIPYYGIDPSFTIAWDDTQRNLECCGVKSWKDWVESVPSSCCKEVYPGKRRDCKSFQDSTTMHMDGCLQKTTKLLRQNALVIGGVAIFETILMLLALIFACALFSKIE